MADQVVSVPLLGGIDESVDPDRIPSPGMKELTNVVIRKKQRFQKREGYSLLSEVGAPNTPATTYSGSTVTNMPLLTEAIAGHRGPAGTKIVTASDSKLFEFVDQDAQHGYRYVNDLPGALGTIIPVDTSSGQCMEVESCIIGPASVNNVGKLRVTAWTVGERPAAVAADDSMWRNPVWDANGLYVAVQRADTGAFIYPPTRIKTFSGDDTTDVRNLRMCECYASNLGPDGEVSCIIAWQSGVGASAKLEGLRVNSAGTILPTVDVFALCAPTTSGLPPTVRSFDIAQVWSSSIGVLPTLENNVVFAICTDDPDVPEVYWFQFDASGTFGWTLISIAQPLSGCTTGRTWTPRCLRGVMIQADKFSPDSKYTLSVRLGLSDSAVAAAPIDMTIVTMLMEPQSPIDGTWVSVLGQWGIIRDMNYQTMEDFTSVPTYALTGGKYYASKTITQFNGDIWGDTTSIANAPLVMSRRLAQQAPVLEATLPDATKQLYAMDLIYGGVLSGNQQSRLYLTSVAPFIPTGLSNADLATWTSVAQQAHQYPASMQLPVNLTSAAVYPSGGALGGTQLSSIATPNCSASNTFSLTPAGYYQNCTVQTVIAGAGITTDATADVVISGGVDILSIAFAGPLGSGLTNGVYFSPVLIQGCSTAVFRIDVTGGQITSITCRDSGTEMTPGVGVPFTIPFNGMYPGSPEFVSAGTCTIDNYASSIILRSCGVYTSPSGYLHRYGTCNGLAPLVGTISTEVDLLQFQQVINRSYAYTFLDGGDTANPRPNPSFAIEPENCVHRWSSCFSTGDDGDAVLLAISSTGANPYTTQAGDAPLSMPFVHSTNNYFETYKWVPSPGETLLRPRWPSGTTSYGISALAGPWRIVADLTLLKRPNIASTTDFNKQRAVVAITPSGDDLQRSQYLVYIGDAAGAMTIVAPPPDETVGSTDWKYESNKGMFVESFNAPRVLTIPFGVSRIFTREREERYGATMFFRTVEACAGIVRDGSSENTANIGAISYDMKPEGWRQTMPYADYTLINGGIVSSFDGASCNEVSPVMWPQRALCTIADELPPVGLFDMDKAYFDATLDANVRASLWEMGVGSGGTRTVCALMNISRPFFGYEAGLRFLGPSPVSPFLQYGGWNQIVTSFGGKPTEDYQSISVDQRMTTYKLNSGVSGNTAPGGAKPVYFYGKYGKYAKTPYLSTAQLGFALSPQSGFVAWLPRNTNEDVGGGSGTVTSCSFSNADAQGDMLMRWVYECTDGTGRLVRSAPSVPSRYTIISRLWTDTKQNQTAVDVYKYGFFAPRLELTNRLRVGADDNKRITLQAYTTAEPFGSVFYRMPLRNWESPATAFTSERGSNRQLCAYEAQPYAVGSSPYGFVTNNLTCFHGTSGEYLGVLGASYLYTTGGEVPNMCPPSVRCMATHRNRIVLGGADDATVIWISKEITEQDAPAFSDLLTVRIADGGAVTGLGSLSRALVVFKADQIHVLTGEMPDNTVAGGISSSPWSQTLGDPYRLVNGLGCISHRSVVSTPVGIFFQSSRAIELMGQNMAITPIGLRVMDVMATYSQVVSTAHKAVDSEVIFCCQKPSVLDGTNAQVDGSQYVLLVYNYAEDIWSQHTMNSFGVGPSTIGEISDQTLLAVGGRGYRTSDTKFFDTTPSGDSWVTMSGETAPIALNQAQGYQRVKRIVIMGDPIPAVPATQVYQGHGMTLQVKTDWDSNQTATWTEAQALDIYNKQGREFFQVHIRDQKCQKISFRWQDSPGTTLNTGYGVAFSNIALTVGVKSGLNKRMTQAAEH